MKIVNFKEMSLQEIENFIKKEIPIKLLDEIKSEVCGLLEVE